MEFGANIGLDLRGFRCARINRIDTSSSPSPSSSPSSSSPPSTSRSRRRSPQGGDSRPFCQLSSQSILSCGKSLLHLRYFYDWYLCYLYLYDGYLCYLYDCYSYMYIHDLYSYLYLYNILIQIWIQINVYAS